MKKNIKQITLSLCAALMVLSNASFTQCTSPTPYIGAVFASSIVGGVAGLCGAISLKARYKKNQETINGMLADVQPDSDGYYLLSPKTETESKLVDDMCVLFGLFTHRESDKYSYYLVKDGQNIKVSQGVIDLHTQSPRHCNVSCSLLGALTGLFLSSYFVLIGSMVAASSKSSKNFEKVMLENRKIMDAIEASTERLKNEFQMARAEQAEQEDIFIRMLQARLLAKKRKNGELKDNQEKWRRIFNVNDPSSTK